MNDSIISIQDIISPSMCEDIIEFINYKYKAKTSIGKDMSNIADIIRPIIDSICIKDRTLSHENIIIDFIQYTAIDKNTKYVSDNYKYINKSWVKLNDFEYVGFIFLNEYNHILPFDDNFEVLGGVLNIKNFNINIKPERGTFILFPTLPNYIYKFSDVIYGNNNIIKILIKEIK